MLYKLQDKDDKVIAYVVYYQINKDRQFDDNGAYIYVEEVWVHDSMRFLNTMWSMLRTLLPRHNNKYIYWVRHKYGDRMSLYEVVRDNGIKLIKKEI